MTKISYPPRKENPHNSFGGNKYPCRCGHYWHDHSMFGGLLYFFGSGKCEECMCPKYQKDKEWNNE